MQRDAGADPVQLLPLCPFAYGALYSLRYCMHFAVRFARMQDDEVLIRLLRLSRFGQQLPMEMLKSLLPHLTLRALVKGEVRSAGTPAAQRRRGPRAMMAWPASSIRLPVCVRATPGRSARRPASRCVCMCAYA